MEAKDNLGNTPLLRACGVGQKDAVELLIESGADMSATASSTSWAEVYGKRYTDSNMAEAREYEQGQDEGRAGQTTVQTSSGANKHQQATSHNSLRVPHSSPRVPAPPRLCPC